MNRLPDVLLLDNRTGHRSRFLSSTSPSYKKYIDFRLEFIPGVTDKIEVYVDEEGMYQKYVPNEWVNFFIHPQFYHSLLRPLTGPVVLVCPTGHSLTLLRQLVNNALRHCGDEEAKKRRAAWEAELARAQEPE